ncbi:unnamed protein product [Brachionus calyciflorus]|uniref:Uncharacterized protein n=1 Tax=Brachionus calyciflorus TaxID=104777 RepID=A0A814BZ59_9BILA|nr:unnamed protein product [Brachionus calyciflorus]
MANLFFKVLLFKIILFDQSFTQKIQELPREFFKNSHRLQSLKCRHQIDLSDLRPLIKIKTIPIISNKNLLLTSTTTSHGVAFNTNKALINFKIFKSHHVIIDTIEITKDQTEGAINIELKKNGSLIDTKKEFINKANLFFDNFKSDKIDEVNISLENEDNHHEINNFKIRIRVCLFEKSEIAAAKKNKLSTSLNMLTILKKLKSILKNFIENNNQD